MLQHFKKILLNFFVHKNIKKLPSKVAYLWQFGFFSLQPRLPKTAQDRIFILEFTWDNSDFVKNKQCNKNVLKMSSIILEFQEQ